MKLYREVLAKQPDGSVTIVAVGPLRNLGNLLKSGPDAVSPLNGTALVAKKVKRLDIMGGSYPPSTIAEGEFNFKQDPASTALVCSTWPTPILFNGDGGSTLSGRRVTYEMPEHNPLTLAYRISMGVGFAADRLSWDPISVLVAVSGANPWYNVVSGGTNVADANTGINNWVADRDGGHSYLVPKSRKAEVETALEDLMTGGKGRPTNLKFNTVYYADSGMVEITQSGGRDQKGVWKHQAPSSWIQYQHVDGRKSLATSYAVTCKNKDLLPRSLELSGSNNGGTTWTRLDIQEAPGFSEQATRREFNVANPSKWNLFRLNVKPADENKGIQVDLIEILEAIDCTPGVGVTSVALDHSALSIPVNGRATLNGSIAPLVKTFERGIKWVSSDPSVAEVRQIGEQTAMVVGKKKGTCTVTGTVDGQNVSCSITVTESTLPEGWGYDELNSPPIPGSLVVSEGKFSLTGCGNAMLAFWERVRDQGVFASKPVTGDVQLTAQLTDLAPNVGGPTDTWADRPQTTSGLMIRELLVEPVDKFFLIQVEASGKLVCRWRDKPSGDDGGQRRELGEVTLPIHLKLSKKGNQIQVFTSANGNDWGEPRMSHSSALGGECRIGLFVCSGNTFASSTGTFENVGIETVATPTSSVATPTFNVAQGTYTGSQAVTVSTATTGATIRYTTNGADPTSSTGTFINGTSGSVTISSSTTLKARAFKSGVTDSGVASATYTISSGSVGSITREVWTGVGGNTIASIPVTITPNITGTISSFEVPINAGDNYGTRVRGYLTAPTTGSYTFWVSGDDNCELWLSTNGSAGSKVRIATVNSSTNSREWTRETNQKSVAISLTGGQNYYIEALQKEGTGGDSLAVGWSKPGESTTAPSEIIPGPALSPFIGAETVQASIYSFRVSNSLAVDGSQDLLTPAKDGVENLLKYAFNMIGTGPDQVANLTIPNSKTMANNGSAGLPRLAVDGNGRLAINYIRRKGVTNPGVTYVVEFSNALDIPWVANASPTESVTNIDSTWERVTVTDTVSPAKRFARLKVSSE